MIPPSPDPGARIDQVLRAYEGAVPGACALVIHEGTPIVRRAFGMADLECGVAATSATNFRLASLSKQFTAAALLLLAEARRVELDARAGRWLAGLPAALRDVTLRQLLTHTSGILDFEELIPAATTAQLRDPDVLELLKQEDRTYFPPGGGYRYSNSGYVLLAAVAAAASGMDYASMLRERIFRPLGMNRSVAHEKGSPAISNRAYGYSALGSSWVRTDQDLTSATLGDGGIYSSIDDWVQWDAALDDDRLLTAESRRCAFTPWTQTDDHQTRYGFGWRITGETVWHSGESVGFRNVVVRFPRRRLSVVILSNRDAPGPYPAALAIAGRDPVQSSPPPTDCLPNR